MKRKIDNMTPQSWFCFLVICSCFIYFFVITFCKNANADPEIKIAVISAASVAANFMIGSSNSSQKKDKVISDLLTPPDGSTEVTTKTPAENVEDVKDKS